MSDPNIDLYIHYEMNCRVRHGIPDDFKKIVNGIPVFRTGIVFFKRDKDLDFYGPFVTGDTYDANSIKELMDEKNIFVFS